MDSDFLVSSWSVSFWTVVAKVTGAPTSVNAAIALISRRLNRFIACSPEVGTCATGRDRSRTARKMRRGCGKHRVKFFSGVHLPVDPKWILVAWSLDGSLEAKRWSRDGRDCRGTRTLHAPEVAGIISNVLSFFNGARRALLPITPLKDGKSPHRPSEWPRMETQGGGFFSLFFSFCLP